jgi:peptidoglycan/xylan/chitin deacetylase (PgdA/CDA1 family)
MMAKALRWGAAGWWRLAGRVARNRQELYGGAHGLRVVTFHRTGPAELAQLRRLVDWARGRFSMATLADVDRLFDGHPTGAAPDRLLLTFDDGLGSNFEAATWLAGAGIPAIFFVVPSFVDRTVAEYFQYHERAGVQAFPPFPGGPRGLSSGQVREMMAMGHRIGAHNFAHRDLGRLHDPADIEYEVGRALEAVGELTGSPCRDFAIGFGQPENLSEEAAAFLVEHCPRVYSCYRGLNVPGISPRFLQRDDCAPWHPFAFTRLCVEGGADHHLADRAREMLRRVGPLPVREEEVLPRRE